MAACVSGWISSIERPSTGMPGAPSRPAGRAIDVELERRRHRGRAGSSLGWRRDGRRRPAAGCATGTPCRPARALQPGCGERAGPRPPALDGAHRSAASRLGVRRLPGLASGLRRLARCLVDSARQPTNAAAITTRPAAASHGRSRRGLEVGLRICLLRVFAGQRAFVLELVDDGLFVDAELAGVGAQERQRVGLARAAA